MAGESVLYNALSSDQSITDVVGNRIYSDIRDQGDTIPAIYFERSATEPLTTMDSFIPAGERQSFILTCFESTREKSEALAGLIILASAGAEFLTTDRQNGFDEETGIYSTTIQLDYLEV